MIGPHVNKVDINGYHHDELEDAIDVDLKYMKDYTGMPVNTAQVFIAGPRNGTVHVNDRQVESLGKYIHKNNLTLLVHDTYVSQPWTYGYVGATREQIKICSKIGAHGPIIHLSPETLSGRGICSQINRIFHSKASKNNSDNDSREDDLVGDHAPIFEVFARKPGPDSYDSIDKISDFCRRLRECHDRKHFGLCIDTAHIYESGIDIYRDDVMRNLLVDFSEKIVDEYEFSPYMHLNDSFTEFESGNDRHESLGHGYIWGQDHKDSPHRWTSLRRLLKYIDKNRVPSILERKASSLSQDFDTLMLLREK